MNMTRETNNRLVELRERMKELYFELLFEEDEKRIHELCDEVELILYLERRILFLEALPRN